MRMGAKSILRLPKQLNKTIVGKKRKVAKDSIAKENQPHAFIIKKMISR